MRSKKSSLYRSRSQAHEVQAEQSQDDIIEQRRKQKLFSRVVGPRIEAYECPKKANKSPAVYVYPQQPAQSLIVSPRSRDIVGLTEEGLDDWFAQSQNRKIENLILSKKEYYMPNYLVTDMKSRWAIKPRPFIIETSELLEGQDKRNYSLYFDQRRISPRHLVEEPSRLLFEYKKLQPKNVENGTAIKKASAVSHGGTHYRSPLLSRAPKHKSPALDATLKMQLTEVTEEKEITLGDNPSVTAGTESGTKKMKALLRGLTFVRALRPKTPLKFYAQDNNDKSQSPVKVTLGTQGSMEMNSTMYNNSIESSKQTLPYHRSAADLLRDTELMKENEDFLQKLIERLNPKKIPTDENAVEDSELAEYETDINTQKLTFERNIYKKLGQLAAKRKDEVNDYVRSINEASESESTLAKLKEITQGDSPDRFLQKSSKLLSKDSRATSINKFSRTLLQKREAQKKRDATYLNKTLDVDNNTSQSKNSSPDLKHRGQTNSRSSYRQESNRCYFSKEAKDRLVQRYFEGQASNSPSPNRRLDSAESREVQMRRQQGMLIQRVNSALIQADRAEDSMDLITEKEPAEIMRKTNMSNLSLKLENFKIRKESSISEQMNSVILGAKEKFMLEPKESSSQESIDFWFVRGSIQMNHGSFYNAIDCFKQILIIDPTYYLCIFNIGCMYERLNNYEAAKKWLQLSYDVDFSRDECLYGLAICDFKSGNAQGCLDYLCKTEYPNKEIESNMNYLKALCCKELNKLDEAAVYYLKVHNKIKNKVGMDFARKIFASLLLTNRNMAANFEETEAKQLIQSTQKYLPANKSPWKLDPYYTKEKEWKPDNLDELVQKLSKLTFWNRFPIEYLKIFTGYIVVEKIKAETVIFPRNDAVLVIITGTISLKDHSVGFLEPKVIAKLQEGDTIGFDTIDNNVLRKSENWMICQSDVEALVVKKDDFVRIWEAQKMISKSLYIDLMQETSLFKYVTTQTLYTISYEVIIRETHKAGTIVYNDNSYMNAHDIGVKTRKRVLTHQSFSSITQHDISIDEKQPTKGKGKNNGNTSMINHKTVTYDSNNDDYERKNKGHLEKNISRGIFIILSGECIVEGKNGYVYTRIGRGDFFGENLLFDTKGYSNYGLIRCKTDEVELLYIPRTEFWRIPKYDVEVMAQSCKNRRGIRNVNGIAESRKRSL